MNWDEYFISIAKLVSTKSKDRSTKVGAVIVGPNKNIVSTGFNGFPRGVNDNGNERHERPAKYRWTEHAERNAIYNAARHGIVLEGASLYLNWEPCPCSDCARAIIQSGIKEVIGPNIPFGGVGSHWSEDAEVSKQMLAEAGVKRTIIYENTVPTTNSP
jgi:dCMP deaminase